jgi:hypothetical protein
VGDDVSDLRIIGWREWVALPELDISRIKAKVDTGARSSSLHAYDIEVFSRRRRSYVRFVVHPVQRETKTTMHCIAELGGERWPIDLTLTTRDSMGFRMLLGREAIRGRFLVEPARSYLCRELVPRRKKEREA